MVTENPGADGAMPCRLAESQSLPGILSVYIRSPANSVCSKKELWLLERIVKTTGKAAVQKQPECLRGSLDMGKDH